MEKYSEYKLRLLRRIENGEDLDTGDVSILLFDEIEREGDDKPLYCAVKSVVTLCGRYFIIHWHRGCYEYEDIYEVEKHTYKKTVTVTEWRKVEKEKYEQLKMKV